MESALPQLSFWVENYSEELIFKSDICSLNFNRKCFWDTSFMLKDASQIENPYFRFKFFLHINGARLFWFFRDIGASSLACGSENYALTGYNTPSLKRKTINTKGVYRRLIFDDEESKLKAVYKSKIQYLDTTRGDYEILSVSMQLSNDLIQGKVQKCIKQNNHRIVCLVQTYYRSPEPGMMMEKNTFYLGRAQKIETTTGYLPRDRYYTWNMNMEKDPSPFPGLNIKKSDYWPFHREQHEDMMQLKVYNSMLSSRVSNKHNTTSNHVPDYDDYSNPLKLTPIQVGDDQEMVVQFFNMSEENRYPVELYLKRHHFGYEDQQEKTKAPPTPIGKWGKKRSQGSALDKRRVETIRMMNMKHEIQKNLFVFIEYIQSNSSLQIHTIMFTAQNYTESLGFGKIGNYLKINSI